VKKRMKPNTSGFPRIPSSLKDNLNFFYILAVVPLLPILYYDAWIFVVAFYGFILLLLKSEKLRSLKRPRNLQILFGLIIITGSFFVYYALILVIPRAAFYSAANYIVFLSGLFLVFFDLSALKQAFTPLFFIAAATSSSLIAEWLKPFFSPFLDEITHLLVNILRVLGINATSYLSYGVPLVEFTSLSGNIIRASFVYECMGVFSALVFSIIIAIVVLEDTSDWKVKLTASVVGVLGTFALNIVRVTTIFLTDYFYGAEAGATVHYIIGYGLFSVWLALFLYLYSKRRTIQMKILSLWRKPIQPKNAA